MELDVDPKYLGKKVSRSQLEQLSDSSDNSEASDEVLDGSLDGLEQESDQESLEGSLEDSEASENSDEHSGEHSDVSDDSGQSEDAGDSDDEEESSQRGYGKKDNLRAELEKLKEAEADLVKNLSASAQSDAEKGAHIRQQIVSLSHWCLTREKGNIRNIVGYADSVAKDAQLGKSVTPGTNSLPGTKSCKKGNYSCLGRIE
jgi:hypothetical protein